jgi:PAS domain S-box-containing protein
MAPKFTRTDKKIHILHVDDDPSVADLTKTYLEREEDRFSVEITTSATDGLEMLRDNPPDCIISDYEMPGMDGIDFLGRVRENHPNLPFILYTGKGSEEVASEAISAGVTDYLQKEGGTEQYTILANRIMNAVEQASAEQEIERTQKYYSQILAHASDYLMIVNEEGNIDYISPAVERVMGYTSDELDGADAFDWTHPDDLSVASKTFSKVIEQPEKEHAVEFRARHADGSWRWLEVRGRNLLDNPVIQGVLVSVRDITERVKDQQKLKRQNDLFAKAQDIADVGAWEYDLENDELIWTEQVYRIHGLSDEHEPTIEKAIEFYHPDDQSTIREAFARAIEDGDTYDVELRLITADDDQRWVQTRGYPRTEDEEINCIRGTIQDITEQKKRQQELQAERRFTQQALDSLNDLFYVLDEEGSVRRWNKSVSAVTGYDESEIESMRAVGFFPTEEREKIAYGIEKTLTEGKATIEADVLTADGQRIPHELTGARLTDEDGNTTGMVGLGRDITERKEREQRLQDERERYLTLFETLPIPVLHGKAEDGEPVVQMVNPAFEETFGYDAEVITGERLHEYILPDDSTENVDRLNQRVIDEEGDITTEVQRETIDGTQTFQLDLNTRSTESGDIHGYAVYTDITERKEYEQKLEAQNERLKQFARIISHDLQQPLNVADGYLELAQETCECEHLDQVINGINRSQTLLEEMLTLLRTGEQPTENESVTLAAVAEQSWQTVETKAATLEINTSRTIRADRSQLQQLFENLYRNAVEHGGPEVTVTVGTLKNGFYIKDDGVGIPDDERKEIFEVSYSTAESGTGFGLSIVEEIVEGHGWNIQVTGGTDSGARFEITGVEFAAE